MELEVKIRKKLRGFDLAVEFSVRDEVLALLGASGCGKSMTLKCIAGIEKPDEGRILLNGRTLFDSEKGVNLAPQERRVGYLFQDYALFPLRDSKTPTPRSSRAGRSSARRSRASSPPMQSYCCSMSHFPRSTATSSGSWSWNCCTSSTTTDAPPSSFRTTAAKPIAWPTTSPS